MSEPFKSGDRVLVPTTLSCIGPRSTKATRQTVYIDAETAIRLPLDDATVERLAKVEYRHLMQTMYVDSPYGFENYEMPNWEDIGDAIQDSYRDRIRAVIAALVGDDQ